jgi:arylsulfatase A-like enzyme
MKKSAIIILMSLSSLACAQEQPNFLFIFADDLSYEAVGAYGNEEVKTPNIDKLSNEGTRFLNAYNMGGWNGAICVAARTSIVTGKTVWRSRIAEENLPEIAEKGQLWPQLLSQAGYETYFTGKWHVKIKPENIFDHVVHERGGMPKDEWTAKMRGIDQPTIEFIQSMDGYNRPVEGELDPWSPFEQSFGGFWEGGKHWSEVLADDATDFLEDAAESEKPFFMYLAFNAPHDPRQAPKRFVDQYPLDSIAIPSSYMPEYPFKDEMGCDPTLRDEALAPFPRTEFAVKTHRQEYYAIISHMDEQIGRILKALEETGKRDNTYIVFAADHGLACGHHGLIGKQNMYEHSMKLPLIVVGPDVPENEKREALVYLQDIMATSLDLAGVNKPRYVEFNSLMPLVMSPEIPSPYDAIYGCYLDDAQRMVRVGDMKLIVYPLAKRVRLFDLANDPDETEDLSGEPVHWSNIRRLFNTLLEKQYEMEDRLLLAAHFPDLLESNDAKSSWDKLIKLNNRLTTWNRDAFAYVEPDPALPNVLIYGDSISIGYTPTVRKELTGKANVLRLHRNGSSSGQVIPFMEELRETMMDPALPDHWDFEWDVIHFNVGLHDLKYVLEQSGLNKEEGTQVTSPVQYARNLTEIINYFQESAPNAKLIFATTTPVPEGEPGRFAGDADKYNRIAREVLAQYPEVEINDLYSFTKPHHAEWWTSPGNVHFTKAGSAEQGKQVAREILKQL